MKKVGKFFKTVWDLFLAVLLVILIFIFIIFGLIFGAFEAVFKYGRSIAMVFLTGIVKGYRKEEKIKTVMQTTMKSKRTH